MTPTSLDWPEVHCLLDALQALIDQHRAALAATDLDDDARGERSNDLAYALVLRGKYEGLRTQMLRDARATPGPGGDTGG